jgi:hypothetical protein
MDRPVFREISRSADDPPINTPTRSDDLFMLPYLDKKEDSPQGLSPVSSRLTPHGFIQIVASHFLLFTDPTLIFPQSLSIPIEVARQISLRPFPEPSALT